MNTLGIECSMTGAHPKTIQAVMRHCSITLTMDQYGHPFPDEQAKLPGRWDRLFAVIDPAKRANHLQSG